MTLTPPLIFVAYVPEAGLFRLTAPYQRRTAVDPHSYGYLPQGLDTYAIVVPAGFQTDFASVPRLLVGIFPKVGKYAGAAVIHDYLYVTQCKGRKWADAVFYELMREDGVGWVTRWTLFLAARTFGREFWK